MKKLLWKIFYGDGTTSTDQDENIPPRDVQAIAIVDDVVGFRVESGGDYYIHRGDDSWVAVDIFGLFDFLLDTGLVLFGRTIPKTEFAKIHKRIMNDPELPRKSNYYKDERRGD